MKLMRNKLIYALAILLAIVFLVAGFFIGEIYKSHYIGAINEQFRKESLMFAEFIEASGGISEIDVSLFKRSVEHLDARMVLLDRNGKRVFDNLGDEEDFQQEEIIQEITLLVEETPNGHYQTGSGPDYSFYWNRIDVGDERYGTVIVGNQLKSLQEIYRQIWGLLFISLGVAFLIILYIGSKIMNRFTKPVEKATVAAMELAKGNYRIQINEDEVGEFSKLNTSINILARNLQTITKEHEMQKERLVTLIENMGSGILLIDDIGKITLINRTYIELFGKSKEEILGKTYLDAIDYEDIKEVINDVFMTEQKIKRQVSVPLGIYMKSFDVYGVPIINEHKEWKGIVVVFHDITDLKKLEQIRKDFVANVSHELKTPVTSIKGFAETLLDGAYKDPKALKGFLEIIFQESDRLQSIISDLLELSKIENEGFFLSLSEVNITELINDVCNILHNRAKEKSISFTIERQDPLYIYGDEKRLNQIFINIISNAISYTPNGGRIYIHFRSQPDWVDVIVRDTGIGIHKKEIPRIFERFYRVDKDRSRNSGGTGLGLAIVKHLVEAHQGRIRVESEPGKGSSFIISFRKGEEM